MRTELTTEELAQPMDKEGLQMAADAVVQFQRSAGWVRLQQSLEAMRKSQYSVLIGAASREHVQLAEASGMIQAIYEFNKMFDRIKKDGETD